MTCNRKRIDATQYHSWHTYLILDVDGLSKLSLLNSLLCTWIQAVLEAVHRTIRDNCSGRLFQCLTVHWLNSLTGYWFDFFLLHVHADYVVAYQTSKQVLLWNLFAIGQNLECLDQVASDAPLFKGCQDEFLQSCVVIKLFKHFYYLCRSPLYLLYARNVFLGEWRNGIPIPKYRYVPLRTGLNWQSHSVLVWSHECSYFNFWQCTNVPKVARRYVAQNYTTLLFYQ